MVSVCCPFCRNAELDFSQRTTDDIEMFDLVKILDPQVSTLTYVSYWIVKWGGGACKCIILLNSLHAVSHLSGYYVILPLRHKPL